jgi:hypothetical protein
LVAGWPEKPLDHTVYDGWKSIKAEKLSVDGKWVLYGLEPQEGDGQLIIRNLMTDSTIVVERSTEGEIARDMRYAVCKVQPFFAQTRRAKIDKKKEDDSRQIRWQSWIADRGSDQNTRLESYKLPKEGSGWLAYTNGSATCSTRYIQSRCTGQRKPEGKKKPDKKKLNLVIRRLNDGREFSYPRVTSSNSARTAVECFLPLKSRTACAPLASMCSTQQKKMNAA